MIHRKLLVASVAVMLAGPLAPVTAAGAQPGRPVSAPGGDGGRTYPVTLVTGDVAALHVAPDGRQAAWLAEPATQDGPARPPQIFEQDGQVHLIPAEAASYLAAGALDERLFDLTSLVGQGYHDAARDDLPLLLEAPTRTLAASADEVRRLESIDAVSVSADKSRIRSVWESLRGPSSDQRLAGARKVWLNGRVEATLDDSVGQVGAPAAWDAGLDGAGVTVSVLDTGHDPDHPDLAGQVAGARNFTEDQDPPGETAVDGHGHGTHVAATVAGTGAASEGARPGVAPGADLLVGKVLGDDGGGYDDWVIAGMEWAVDQGAQVVNLSLGTPWADDGNHPLSQAVDRLSESSDTLFVVAAGNAGPREQTVGAPGAAARALTVGATTKDDQPAGFSSRGPRRGDLMIKPELVAPGEGIVAARASGTSLGNLLDEDYTSLNGTSMATPHVAGAAAIVAQQHPHWSADELKARLVTTSQPLADLPLSFQGAGRLDVAAATSTPVTVSDGTLSLGRVAIDADPLTRTLTYRNASDRTAVLRLSAEVTGIGLRDVQKPALSMRPPLLVVPAGGEASTEVRLSPGTTPAGGYEGQIVARDLRNPSTQVQTAMAFTVEGPPRTVTVRGTDRNGEPADGNVQLWSAETGQLSYGFLADGVATLQVPDGRYSLVAALETIEGSWPPASITVAGDPELTIRRDTTISYDARQGQPLEVTTPREAVLDRFHVTWRRELAGRSVTSVVAQSRFGEDLYTLPSRQPTAGSFEVSTTWQLAESLLDVQIPGGPPTHPWFAGWADPYVGTEPVPVVDAGLGTPEEFAGLDAEGKVALVTRRGDWQLGQQAAAAAEAGALLLLAHNDRPGAWRENTGNALPVYLIDQAEGERIREALADDPELALDLAGRRDASYSYHLVFPEPRIPAGQTYAAGDHPMATVVSDYRESSERMGRREWWIPYVGSTVLGTGLSFGRHGPVERTEYVSTGAVQWQRFAQPHGEFPGLYWTSSTIAQYRADQTYHQLWWGPLTRPGVPAVSGAEEAGAPVARFRDAIRVVMRHYLYDNGALNGTIFEQMGDRSLLTLRRDGEVVGTSTWPEAQFTVPETDAEYELELAVVNGSGHFSDLSVRTESTWRFHSQRPAEPRRVLPLVQLDYQLDAGPHNEVAPGTSYPLRIDPGYQPGANGPGGFTVTVEVSYDGGETWTGAPVAPSGGTLAATMPAAPPAATFATVRVVATDSAGNRLTQRIDQAWRIGEP